jgi:hypothetical protein
MVGGSCEFRAVGNAGCGLRGELGKWKVCYMDVRQVYWWLGIVVICWKR